MPAKRSKYEGINASDRARARMRYTGETPRGHPLWTEQENEIFRELFPDYVALKKRLRRRSMEALRSHAYALQITRRRQSAWTANEVSRLRSLWRDAPKEQIIAAIPRHTWYGIQCKGHSFGVRRLPWQPKLTGQRMLDEIRRRAADLRISLRDLDRTCVGRRYFANSSRRSQKPRRNVLLRAIAALGGRVEIVWR
jgi:hypothetical protein